MDTLPPLMAIVLFANAIEAIAGFGSTLIAVSLGALFFPIEDLVPILVPLNLLLSLVIVIRHPQHLNRRELFVRILPIAAIGMPVGILIFQYAPGNALKLAFGAIIAALGAVELARALRTTAATKTTPTTETATPAITPTETLAPIPEPASPPLAPIPAFAALFAGGIMQGLYASGGPFIVYYSSRALRGKGEFRTTLSVLWLILNIFLAGSLALTGKISYYTLVFSGYLLPFVVAGIVLGMKVHHHVSETQFRRGVYGLLAVSGVTLILRSL